MSLLSFAFLLLFCFREKEDFGSGKVWSQETVFRNGLHKQQRQQAAKNLDSNLWPKICIQKHMLTEDEIQNLKSHNERLVASVTILRHFSKFLLTLVFFKKVTQKFGDLLGYF